MQPRENSSLDMNASGDGRHIKGKKQLIEASGSVSGVKLSVTSSRRISKARVAEPLLRESGASPKLLVVGGTKDSLSRMEEERHRMVVDHTNEAIAEENGSTDAEVDSMKDSNGDGEEFNGGESDLEMNKELDDSLTLGKFQEGLRKEALAQEITQPVVSPQKKGIIEDREIEARIPTECLPTSFDLMFFFNFVPVLGFSIEICLRISLFNHE